MTRAEKIKKQRKFYRQLLAAWNRHVVKQGGSFSVAQTRVAKALMKQISCDAKVSKFFRARRTGVTHLFVSFEQFCRSAQL